MDVLIDSLKSKVEVLSVPKGNLGDNYLHHLSSNPERVDSIIMLFFFTFVVWAVIWYFRKDLLKGLAGDGKHPGDTSPDNLDAREQVIFIYYFIFPPAIFYILFFKDTRLWQQIAMCITVAPGFYQIFGTFIFNWILAVRSGQSKVTSDTPTTTTTTTTKTE